MSYVLRDADRTLLPYDIYNLIVLFLVLIMI